MEAQKDQMEPPAMRNEEQTIVAKLDEQYDGVLEEARLLNKSYISASIKLYKKTGIKSGIAAISIKQTSQNAYSIYWCKLVPLQGKQNKFLPLTIAKGNGKYKYSPSSFQFVEYTYRFLVLQVEERLAEIRKIASENRQLRRTIVAYESKLSRYQSRKYGELYSGK